MRSKATMTGKLLAQTMHGRPHGPGLRPPAANKKLRALTDCPTCRSTGKVESRLPFDRRLATIAAVGRASRRRSVSRSCSARRRRDRLNLRRRGCGRAVVWLHANAGYCNARGQPFNPQSVQGIDGAWPRQTPVLSPRISGDAERSPRRARAVHKAITGGSDKAGILGR
jgi:hypothetical protein